MSSAPVRSTPPALALRLLRRVLRGEEGEALLGDLLEKDQERRTAGIASRDADRRFWRESVSALLAARALRRGAGVRSSAGESALRTFIADMRHGARLLRRAPSFTVVCVFTLALAIGATTAIFAVVNPVLIRSLPFPDPERLTVVWERNPDGSTKNVGYATYVDLVGASRTLDRAAAVGGWEPTIAEGGDPERLVGQRVTFTFFSTLGVRPEIGRDFSAAEDLPGAHHVVILGYGLWQRRFGGDSSVVGRTIALDDVPHLVAGVLPASFSSVLQPEAQIWRVLGYDASLPQACRSCRHLRMIARVRGDVALESAAAELNALATAIARDHPNEYPVGGTLLVPMHEQVTRNVRPVLMVLLGAVALVLLMAAANVANLQLSRALRRDGEFAIRTALGARKGRLARQLLAEGTLLAALGGVAGLALATLALPLLVRSLPDSLPRLAEIRLDGQALLLCATLTIALGLLVGLAPALGGRREAGFTALRDGGRHTGGVRQFVRAGLVTVEVALALMLLVGAGLLGRSLATLMAVDPGFTPGGVLTMQVQSTGEAYRESERVWSHRERMRESVHALPGVEHVAHSTQLPLSGGLDSYGIRAEGRTAENPALAPSADRFVVSPGFHEAMDVPLRLGRTFTQADNSTTGPQVVILSESLARGLWPGEDPLGKRVQIGGYDTPWREVVGVVGDVRNTALDADVMQQVYIPERQWPWADGVVTMFVRTSGNPAAIAPAVRRAVRELDETQPVSRVMTMSDVVAGSVAQRRLALVLFGAFGATALLMAIAGIYGVLAGSVAERTREIGLRSALGASPRAIFALVVRRAAWLVLFGCAAGLLGALGLSRFLAGMLYEVRPTDPVTLIGVSALLTLVALMACLGPVRRALGVDPVAALRAE